MHQPQIPSVASSGAAKINACTVSIKTWRGQSNMLTWLSLNLEPPISMHKQGWGGEGFFCKATLLFSYIFYYCNCNKENTFTQQLFRPFKQFGQQRYCRGGRMFSAFINHRVTDEKTVLSVTITDASALEATDFANPNIFHLKNSENASFWHHAATQDRIVRGKNVNKTRERDIHVKKMYSPNYSDGKYWKYCKIYRF